MSNFPNAIAWLFGPFLTLLPCYWAWLNRGSPWRVSVLFSAVILLMLSAFQLGLFMELVAYIDALPEAKRQPESTWAAIRSSSAYWLALLPVVSGGVGVNLLSSWLTARKPE